MIIQMLLNVQLNIVKNTEQLPIMFYHKIQKLDTLNIALVFQKFQISTEQTTNNYLHIKFFSSNQIFDNEDEGNSSAGTGPISGVTFKAGINEKNNKKSFTKYTKTGGTCAYDANIKAKAVSLIAGKKTVLEKARNIFNFVRDNIEYEKYENSVYKAKGTLKRKKGNCCDQSNLLISL